MELKELIEKYLNNNHIMQLATLENGMPVMCTLHYAVNKDLNLFWVSMKDTQHSKNIRESKFSSIAVVENVEARQCVHAQGGSLELSSKDVVYADKIYSTAFGEDEERKSDIVSGKDLPYTFYVFKPSKFVLFDPVSFPDNPRQEYQL